MALSIIWWAYGHGEQLRAKLPNRATLFTLKILCTGCLGILLFVWWVYGLGERLRAKLPIRATSTILKAIGAWHLHGISSQATSPSLPSTRSTLSSRSQWGRFTLGLHIGDRTPRRYACQNQKTQKPLKTYPISRVRNVGDLIRNR